MDARVADEVTEIILRRKAPPSMQGWRPTLIIGGRTGEGEWTGHSLGNMLLQMVPLEAVFAFQAELVFKKHGPLYIIDIESPKRQYEADRKKWNAYLLQLSTIAFSFRTIAPFLKKA